MSRSSILIILGVLTLLTPFSGLPGTFRTLLAVAFGAAVLGIGIAERSKEQRRMLAAAAVPAGDAIASPIAAPIASPAPAPLEISKESAAIEPPRTVSPI